MNRNRSTDHESVTQEDAPAPWSLQSIGNYRLIEKVGEGGMGEVYQAEQLAPVRRRVALKFVKAGMDSRQVLARFESERQALALMNHPNIARVFDAGTSEQGRPYFAMEYVKGEPINHYCDKHRLSTLERLELFTQVCDGVQHAHQNGIIHRDLKPSNVLVQIQDQRPVPKIIDFGVAKATQQRLTERTMFTQLGVLVGTPEYMSPEQAEMTGLDVDTRTDVYSLGVMLYDLLVGTRPFDVTAHPDMSFDEIRRRIREDEPSKPSTRVTTLGGQSDVAARQRHTDPSSLRKQLRGDLDWITMKALEKDRTRRYGSPNELAADIARYRNHEPVIAGPPSTAYRLRKFVRRHRVGVGAGALVVLALVGGLILATYGLLRAKRAEAQARRDAETAHRVSASLAGMFGDLNPSGMRGSITTPGEILDRGAERIEAELAGQPLVQAHLLTVMGGAQTGLGHYERARGLLERSAAIRRDQLGPEHPDYAVSIAQLGDLLTRVGEYAQARQFQEQALAIRIKAHGPDHISVAQTLRSLGWLHWRMSEFATSRSLLERALTIGEATLGADHLDTAVTLRLQALVELDSGDYKAALPLLERSSAIHETVLGPDHTEVGWTLFEMGRLRRESGDLEHALPFYERSLAIHEAALGPDHYAVSFPLDGIAWIRMQSGDLDTAREMFVRALAIREGALGVDHPDLVWILRGYSVLLSRSGDVEGARASLERALTIVTRAYGPEHLDVARVLGGRGHLEYRQGNLAQAREYMQRDLAIREKIFGPDHRSHGVTLYNLACLAALDGDRQLALGLLRRMLDVGYSTTTMIEDRDLDSLRGDPGFEEILATVRQQVAS